MWRSTPAMPAGHAPNPQARTQRVHSSVRSPSPRLSALLTMQLPLLLAACAAQQPITPAPTTLSPPPAASAASAATTQPTAGGAADATAPKQVGQIIETARASVRATTIWLARGVDSWFGDRPFEEGGKVSNGQLEISVLQRRRESADWGLRINARFALPNIDRLGYVFVGRDNEREVITDRPGALSRRDQLQVNRAQDNAFFAGVGRALGDRFDFRIGVRGAFKPYAQARFHEHWPISANTQADFRQTLFLTVDDRLGSTTAVSLDHTLSPSLGLRWLAATTVTQALPKFVWASSLGAYQSFGGQRLLSLETLVNGQQGSGVDALDYGVQARWEQPVHQDWLLGGVVVGHFWPRPDAQSARRGAWALGASLKMRF